MLRFLVIAACAATALTAGGVFLIFGTIGGITALDLLRAALVLIATFWLAWGAALAILGLVARPPRHPPLDAPLRARVVVLVPIFAEDPAATFSRIAAMDASLRQATNGAGFDFAILSDTQDDAQAAQERHWYLRLLQENLGEGRIFYRRRADNQGRKAGNIADFIRTSGAAYDYAIILDADSIMEGATMRDMALRLQADPALGLLQTLPVVVNARSRFARLMQFAAGFHGPVFARGLARLQGRTGPFWGHNAIIRIRAFAQSCGLPDLPGAPPFGGPIMSHDYVEAALMARGGWNVRLDTDLGGSFEETPETLIDHAKRDRRWCQGNLQHLRLVAVQGLPGWSRFVFVQGIFAYLLAPVWMGFVLTSILTEALASGTIRLSLEGLTLPVVSRTNFAIALGLMVGVLVLLVLPKALNLCDAVLHGRTRGFGGVIRSTASAVAELLVLSLLTPILLMYQLRAIGQILRGRDGGWPAQDRTGGAVTLREAYLAAHWIVSAGCIGVLVTLVFATGVLLWLLPVMAPMIAAPLLIAATAKPAQGWLFATPQTLDPSPVLRDRTAILTRWTQTPDAAVVTAKTTHPAGLPRE
nr:MULTISPECIES: glucans biosynthesis glucosyltransferase MdoH [unclassified Yoonia]